MRTSNLVCEPTPTDTLVCEYAHHAYGVTFLPWDDRIRLAPPPATMHGAARVKGVLTIANRLIPVIDLRSGTTGAGSFLLMVSMADDRHETLALGLLVSATDGQFHIPADLIQNFARTN